MENNVPPSTNSIASEGAIQDALYSEMRQAISGPMGDNELSLFIQDWVKRGGDIQQTTSRLVSLGHFIASKYGDCHQSLKAYFELGGKALSDHGMITPGGTAILEGNDQCFFVAKKNGDEYWSMLQGDSLNASQMKVWRSFKKRYGLSGVPRKNMKIIVGNLSDKMTFGKYLGMTIEEIHRYDHQHLVWAMESGVIRFTNPEDYRSIFGHYPDGEFCQPLESTTVIKNDSQILKTKKYFGKTLREVKEIDQDYVNWLFRNQVISFFNEEQHLRFFERKFPQGREMQSVDVFKSMMDIEFLGADGIGDHKIIHSPSDIVHVGQYKGKSLSEIFSEDPSYLAWMFRNKVISFSSIEEHCVFFRHDLKRSVEKYEENKRIASLMDQPVSGAKVVHNLDFVMTFGKHNGRTIRMIQDIEINYIHWMVRTGIIAFARNEQTESLLKIIGYPSPHHEVKINHDDDEIACPS